MKTLRETLTDVPDERMLSVVDDFTGEGADVSVTRQADGKWTIRAEFTVPPSAGRPWRRREGVASHRAGDQTE